MQRDRQRARGRNAVQLHRRNAIAGRTDETAGNCDAALLCEAACLIAFHDHVQGITIGGCSAGRQTYPNAATAHDTDVLVVQDVELTLQILLAVETVDDNTLEVISSACAGRKRNAAARDLAGDNANTEMQLAGRLLIETGVHRVVEHIVDATCNALAGCIAVGFLNTHLTFPPSSFCGRSCAGGPRKRSWSASQGACHRRASSGNADSWYPCARSSRKRPCQTLR